MNCIGVISGEVEGAMRGVNARVTVATAENRTADAYASVCMQRDADGKSETGEDVHAQDANDSECNAAAREQSAFTSGERNEAQAPEAMACPLSRARCCTIECGWRR
eukprot:735027-Pleurochrysis_carterae.AAC.1